MKKLNNLSELFTDQLKELFFLEKELVAILPAWAGRAESSSLTWLIEAHVGKTNLQIARIENVFTHLQIKPGRVESKIARCFIDHTQQLVSKANPEFVANAALVLCLQCLNHFEIALYGTLLSYAELMGQKEISEILRKSLDEEKEADRLLTKEAEQNINEKARDLISLPD